MRRIAVVLIAALSLLSIVSCGKPAQAATTVTEVVSAEPVLVSAKVELTGNKGVPMTLASGKNVDNGHDYGTWTLDASTEKLIPWVGDVREMAKAEQSLRFYFMAGEDVEVAGVQTKIGDACLVVFPDGTTMLVDAAQTESGSINKGYGPVLLANLQRMGIDYLDYVLITHPHGDHYACFTNDGGIADTIPVGKLFYNGVNVTGNTNVINACKRNGIEYEILLEGDELDIGGVHIDILNPSKAQAESTANETVALNNSSILMFMTYCGRTALLTGDLYEAGMKTVVNKYGNELDVDVVKACHHGHSETSIHVPFIQAADPALTVVSSGVPYNYTVYKTYAGTGSLVMNDYLDGYIVLTYTKDSTIDIRTSRVRGSDFYSDLDQVNYYADIYEAPYVQETIEGVKWKKVKDEASLLKAVKAGEKYIQVTADFDMEGYDSYNPLTLELDGVVIDFCGHRIDNLKSDTFYRESASLDAKYATSASLIFSGKDYTIRNAVMNVVKGAYAFTVGTMANKSSGECPNVVLENITIENGGLEIHGCEATMVNVNAIIPADCKTPFPTLLAHRCDLHVQGGSLINETTAKQTRFLFQAYSNVTIGNNVEVKGTVYTYIEDSRLTLEKSKVEY